MLNGWCHGVNLIISKAFKEGTVPDYLKNGIISPLLQNVPLDPGNFRPIPKMHMVAKAMEKVVCNQLQQYVEANEVLSPFQSDFTKEHSTESMLVSIWEAALENDDQGIPSLLVLLDLLLAFDTDLDILLWSLREAAGIKCYPTSGHLFFSMQ